jgi:hypothetical protein
MANGMSSLTAFSTLPTFSTFGASARASTGHDWCSQQPKHYHCCDNSFFG